MASISNNEYNDKLHYIANEYNNIYHKIIKIDPVDGKSSTYITLM